MNQSESTTALSLLPPEMQDALAEAARAENRQPEELIQDAVRQYLKDRHWQKLLWYGQERAHTLGYDHSDVDRLIEEFRRERQSRHH
jgi:metal-responsive CopG/Arc/MetJ family transcriptional regulator